MDRRHFLRGAAGLGIAAAAAPAASAPLADLTVEASMRGAIDAQEFGVWPGAVDPQSQRFRSMLERAAERRMPVFLPPGTYTVSNIRLPDGTSLHGVPGATRLVYGGDGFMLAGEDAARIELYGLTIDGANRALGDAAQALVEMRRVEAFTLDGCELAGSTGSAIACEKVSGRIERCRIAGAADYAIYSVEAGDLQITGNSISDCANGGILVHRWQAASDGTRVIGNRVERIGARSGGTGQYGNGINVFRADNVVVSNNVVNGCAFSAIRGNSAGNIQIVANQCIASGETAIYSEFAFEGAVVNANVVDGAAHGISLVNLDHGGRLGVCSGNIVRNLTTRGPYQADAPGFGAGISLEADIAATGNVIEGAPLYGILIGWGPYLRNVVATGNVIRASRIGIAVSVVEDAGSALITDNLIDGARDGAIVGHRWADAVTGDLAEAGPGGYAHLRIERNLVS
jgi:uncharacterized secreted repeat protein (TIGR03808 family)